MLAAALRPRSGPEIIDAAIQLLRVSYGQLVVVNVVIFAPVIVLRLILPDALSSIASVVSWLLNSAAAAAVVLVASESYLGHPVSITAVLRRVFSRFWTIFGAAIFQGLYMALGFFLLVIPGFIFFAQTFAMPMAVILEGCGVNESFARSQALTRGSKWRVFLILVVTMFVWLVFVGGVGGIIGGLVGPRTTGAEVLSQLLTILTYPVYAVVATLLYYDLRMRKEGFDLEVMAREMGIEVGAMPAPVA